MNYSTFCFSEDNFKQSVLLVSFSQIKNGFENNSLKLKVEEIQNNTKEKIQALVPQAK